MTQEKELNLTGKFTVASMPGIAFRIKGYKQEWSEENGSLLCEDESEDHDHEDYCYLYTESELVENRGFVVAVMVGDDKEHIVDVSELTEIGEEDYCHGCGSTVCACDRWS